MPVATCGKVPLTVDTADPVDRPRPPRSDRRPVAGLRTGSTARLPDADPPPTNMGDDMGYEVGHAYATSVGDVDLESRSKRMMAIGDMLTERSHRHEHRADALLCATTRLFGQIMDRLLEESHIAPREQVLKYLMGSFERHLGYLPNDMTMVLLFTEACELYFSEINGESLPDEIEGALSRMVENSR